MNMAKSGKRHPLLFYRRAMDRLWVATFFLGLILGVVWLWFWWSDVPLISPGNETWLLAGSVAALAFAIFAFFSRRVAYVQPHRDHLRLVTPFLRINISYRRVRSVHPAGFQQLFPPAKASWAQRSFLEPFYGRTAVVVELTSYPMSPLLLRFFLAPQMFSPQSAGFVFLVPDWMEFSTELDTFRSTKAQSQPSKRPRKKSW